MDIHVEQLSLPLEFRDPKGAFKSMRSNIESTATSGLANTISQLSYVDLTVKPNYIQVRDKQMANKGVIDLKPYFATSSKRRAKKNGGWYLIIPIRVKTKDMTSSQYSEVRKAFSNATNESISTAAIDGLFTGKSTPTTLNALNYKPKSDNLSRIGSKNNAKSTYIAFRTVSDKSAPSSWIIGRGSINKDTVSKTFEADLNRAVKYYLRQQERN